MYCSQTWLDFLLIATLKMVMQLSLELVTLKCLTLAEQKTVPTVSTEILMALKFGWLSLSKWFHSENWEKSSLCEYLDILFFTFFFTYFCKCFTDALLGGCPGGNSCPEGISLIPFEDPNEMSWFQGCSSLQCCTIEFHSLMSSLKSAIRWLYWLSDHN